MSCGLLGWRHRQRQRHDLRWIAVLIEACPDMALARQIWDRALDLPLFEHWRCACGQEFAATVRRVYFAVDAAHEDDGDLGNSLLYGAQS